MADILISMNKTTDKLWKYADEWEKTPEHYDGVNPFCVAIHAVRQMTNAPELLKHDEQTIESLERTIDKLTKALAEKPEQKFFVDSDGKITPLPKQKHGYWVPIKSPTGVEYGGFEEYTVSEVMCSECGFTDDVSASIYTYCPECGAKMDREVKQDG